MSGERDETNEIDAFIRRADPSQCRRLVTILSKQSCRRLIFNFLTAEPSSPRWFRCGNNSNCAWIGQTEKERREKERENGTTASNRNENRWPSPTSTTERDSISRRRRRSSFPWRVHARDTKLAYCKRATFSPRPDTRRRRVVVVSHNFL